MLPYLFITSIFSYRIKVIKICCLCILTPYAFFNFGRVGSLLQCAGLLIVVWLLVAERGL